MTDRESNSQKEKSSFSLDDFAAVQKTLEMSLEGFNRETESLAGEFLEALLKLTGMDAGGIYFVQNDSGDLVLVCHSGLSERFVEGSRYYKSGSKRAELIKCGKPAYLDSEEMVGIIDEQQSGDDLKSLAVLPVNVAGKVVACINLASRKSGRLSGNFRRNIEEIMPAVNSTIDRIWSRWNLQRSERKYRAVFDNIHQFAALIDTDGRVVEINRATKEFTDRSEEQIIGNRMSESIVFQTDPELPGRIREARERAAGGETVRFEAKLQNERGRVFFIDFSLRPVLGDSGDAELIICEGRDITDYVKLTNALRESEENYRTIFDSVEDAIFIQDLADGVVLDVNKKMIEMYGYSSKDEVLGKSLVDFSSGEYPYSAEFIREKLSDIYSALPASMEWYARRRDGSLFWVEVNAKVVRILGNERVLAVVKDITDRKKVEEELRDSEQKYRNIVENSREAIVIVDDSYKIVFANNRLLELLGRDKENVLEHDFRAFLDERSRPLLEERYIRRRKGEDVPGRYEFNIVRKDGEVRRVEIGASLIELDEKILTMALLLDITERERAEKRFRTLFESSKDAIMIMNPDTLRFEEMNPAALELFEVGSRKEFYSLTPVELSPEFQPDGRDSEEKAREMVDLAKREGSHFFEWVHLTMEKREVYCTVFLIRIELGGREFIQATVRDVSKRKAAEIELEGLRDYLRDIFNSMPSVLIGVNADGVVTQWNDEAERVTGLKPQEARGRKLEKAYPALKEELGLVRDAISNNSARKDLRAARHIDGETYYKDIMIFPVIHRGMREAMIREDDVTDKVRFEEMIVQSEKMLSLGGFAAGMAHEINNPLAVIIQNASVISNRLTADMPANRETADRLGLDFDALREYVESREISEMTGTIIDFGKRAASVVRDMLSFSRKGDIRKAAVDINEAVSEAIDLARKDISLHLDECQITTELKQDLPPVICEKNKMVQALLNIIKNAAEALKNKDSKDRKIAITTSMNGERVGISIWDNGQGIDIETIEHVFEPFYTTKKNMGMGLGLSIAYFIITESYAGTINVQSEEGEWTEFNITLPVDSDIGN